MIACIAITGSKIYTYIKQYYFRGDVMKYLSILITTDEIRIKLYENPVNCLKQLGEINWEKMDTSVT